MNRLRQLLLVGVVLIAVFAAERFGLIETGLLDELLGGQGTATTQTTTPTTGGQSQVTAGAGCGGNLGLNHPERADLITFARQNGLQQAAAFAGTAITIHETGRLPDCYLTKRQARDRGWSPGTSVWAAGNGTSIGGDRFGNREGRLPSTHTGRYIEADLDYTGARGRNAKRLVFVQNSRGEWLQWLTVDHYDSFRKVTP